ncbi:hypothetical protein [Streptomyces youssoufiensis]
MADVLGQIAAHLDALRRHADLIETQARRAADALATGADDAPTTGDDDRLTCPTCHVTRVLPGRPLHSWMCPDRPGAPGPACGARAAGVFGRSLGPCIRAAGHEGEHQEDSGARWQAAGDKQDDLAAEVARLRAGEQRPAPDRPIALCTAPEWIWHWNRATAESRLATAQRVLDSARQASVCFEGNHRKRLDQFQRRAEQTEEERDEARAALDRVRAELHALDSEVGLTPVALAGRRAAIARVRAALEQPVSEPTTP